MTARVQQVYGLRVRSDRELPGLPAAPVEGSVDVEVIFSAPAPVSVDEWEVGYESPVVEGTAPTVVLERHAPSGATRLRYAEGIRFTFDREAARLWVAWDPPLTFADAVIFLTGPVLGHVLRRRGVLALHASAVVIGEMAVALVGPGGAGKSTLAAALAALGHPFVTDDVLALRPSDGRWWVSPGYENVRIWEASERLLFGVGGRLAPVSGTWEKRVLPAATAGFRLQAEPVPIGALVLLDRADAAAPAAEMRAPRGQETLLTLVANSYVGYLLGGAARAAEMGALADVVRGTKVGHLVPAGAGSSPSELASVVVGWSTGAR